MTPFSYLFLFIAVLCAIQAYWEYKKRKEVENSVLDNWLEGYCKRNGYVKNDKQGNERTDPEAE